MSFAGLLHCHFAWLVRMFELIMAPMCFREIPSVGFDNFNKFSRLHADILSIYRHFNSNTHCNACQVSLSIYIALLAPAYQLSGQVLSQLYPAGYFDESVENVAILLRSGATMRHHIFCLWFFLLLLVVGLPTHAQKLHPGATVTCTLPFDGRTREYWLHVPKGYDRVKPTPLVVVLHGGLGTAVGVEPFTGFTPIADREGFVVVYPQGVDKSWNDGRPDVNTTASQEQIDDVGFIEVMVKAISDVAHIDQQRIFATGISNGAIMSFHLAQKSAIFAAIAPVAGCINVNDADNFHPAHPVSVLLINGDADPLVPYLGGKVGRGGLVISAEASVDKWLAADKIIGHAAVNAMPDIDTRDGCTAERLDYPPAPTSARVSFITVHHGGHTWPGGKQYLPIILIGRLCRDFSASEVIWKFFAGVQQK